MPNNRWTLTGDDKHFRIIKEALDLYSRLLCGQMEELSFFFRINHIKGENKLDPSDYSALDQLIAALKRLLFPKFTPGMSYGIFSPETPQDAKIAWELIQKIRYRMAWDAAGNPPKRIWPEMISIDYDDFMPCSDHPYKAEVQSIMNPTYKEQSNESK